MLSGVVVHKGIASAGHYYSYVRDKAGSVDGNPSQWWFKFNDEEVTRVHLTEEEFKHEFFGGKFPDGTPDANGYWRAEQERFWSAYMLYYERVGVSTPEPLLTEESGHLARVSEGDESA